MTPPRLSHGDALLIVDVQNDFCPGGALPIKEGDRVAPVLNRWIEAANGSGAVVAASRDWHPRGHASFEEQGGRWPIHCVENTWGADFHPSLNLPADALIISKGTGLATDNYSAFDGTDLSSRLKQRGARRVWIGGLAQEICVRATVLDALKAGFEVHLIQDAARPLDVQAGRDALEEMAAAGCFVESRGGDG
jgi:nicotinamidase/pyrazinamidase